VLVCDGTSKIVCNDLTLADCKYNCKHPKTINHHNIYYSNSLFVYVCDLSQLIDELSEENSLTRQKV
jgi:hypothetical protein